MRKIYPLLLSGLLFGGSAHAQFLKKLGRALDKVGQVADALSGTPSTAAGARQQVCGVTFQEEASFVSNWGTLKCLGAVGNSQTGDVQIVVQVSLKNNNPFTDMKADKVFGPDGQALTEGTHWNRNAWALDKSRGLYGSLGFRVPTSYKSLSHVCIVTFLGDIWADIYNIPIEWREPAGETAPAATATAAQSLTITGKGVGPIQIGMKCGAWPAAATGLYDRVEKDYNEVEDETVYNFYRGEECALTVNELDGKVSGIYVTAAGPSLAGTGLGVGSPAHTLPTLAGVTQYPQTEAEPFCFETADGVRVYLTCDAFTPAAEARLSSARPAIKASDLTATARIEQFYIYARF